MDLLSLWNLFIDNIVLISLLDICIIVVFCYYAFEGYSLGFVRASADLVSFVTSFLLGLRFYAVVGSLLITYLGLTPGFANACGFFLIAFVTEVGIRTLLGLLVVRIKVTREFVKINRIAGVVPGLLSAGILLSFLLALVVTLPLSAFVKKTVASSELANQLVASTQGIEQKLNDVFGGAVNETLTFLTVAPQSDESVQLHFTTTSVTTDAFAENEMLSLVNKERQIAGLPPVVADEKLRAVARAHARDMFARGYFSHITPGGISPFDRMAKASISFAYAGENLALAPNTGLAHKGLMKSPGHRANILSPNFGRVGIGVIDGGIYGEMFVQEFTD